MFDISAQQHFHLICFGHFEIGTIWRLLAEALRFLNFESEPSPKLLKLLAYAFSTPGRHSICFSSYLNDGLY